MLESTTTDPTPAPRRLTVLFVLVGVLAALQGWQVYLVVKAPWVKQYQYLVESPSDQVLGQCLSNMGVTGWEVVATRRVTVPSRRLLTPASEVTQIIAKRPLGQAGILNPPPNLGC
jgi:hypothetical protein